MGRGCTTTVTMSLRPLPSVHPCFVLPFGCRAIQNVFTPLQISTVLHNTWLVVMMRQNDRLKHSLRSTVHLQYASTAMSPQQSFLSITGRDHFQETALHLGWYSHKSKTRPFVIGRQNIHHAKYCKSSHRIVRRVTRHSAGMVCTTSGWPCLPRTPS